MMYGQSRLSFATLQCLSAMPGWSRCSCCQGQPATEKQQQPVQESHTHAAACICIKADSNTSTMSGITIKPCPAEGDTDSFGPSQPPGSGWDNDIPPQKPEPAPTRSTGRGNTANPRGRGSNNKGREPSAVTPEHARNAPETGGGRQADAASSTMPGATWDEDVPVPSAQVCLSTLS